MASDVNVMTNSESPPRQTDIAYLLYDVGRLLRRRFDDRLADLGLSDAQWRVIGFLHGSEGLSAAKRISEALFSGDISSLTSEDLQQLELDGLPCSEFENTPQSIVDVLVSTELAKSNKMAREFIGNNAVSVNGQMVDSEDFQLSSSNALNGQFFILKRGKKLFHLAKLS